MTNNCQTSLSSFLYEPVHGKNIAWCLSLPFNVKINIFGPSTINFTNILLDNGSNWKTSSSFLQSSTNGTYYIQFLGYSSPWTGYEFNLILSLNDQPLMNVMEKVGADLTNGNVRSCSLIATLTNIDQLTVGIPTGYVAHNHRNDLMFSGFLISL